MSNYLNIDELLWYNSFEFDAAQCGYYKIDAAQCGHCEIDAAKCGVDAAQYGYHGYKEKISYIKSKFWIQEKEQKRSFENSTTLYFF